jgi:hypothetical protein
MDVVWPRNCPLLQRLQPGDAEVVEEPTEQPSGFGLCLPRSGGNVIRIQELR